MKDKVADIIANTINYLVIGVGVVTTGRLIKSMISDD